MKRIAAALLIAPAFLWAANQDEVNNFTGIDIDFSGTQGTDYAEEYLYHDTGISDRRVVYIKSATTISFSHNSSNAVANGYGGYHKIIGADGDDGVADSGDEGDIRYKVDRDLYKAGRYAGDHATLYAAYSTPLSFATLQYHGTTDDVLGTTGHTTGDLTDTDEYWQGIVDSVGDEWHTIAFWDDDEDHLLASDSDIKEEYWASDGKEIHFVVNPKTPALQIWTSGDAEYYTTPAKTYWIPKIHDQATYFSENTGGISIQIIDINGNNVFYRIGGSGSFTDAGSNSVTLDEDDFSTGSNTLEYYYAGNVAYTKTRIVVKNPTHPSLAEDHGHVFWNGDETHVTTMRDRFAEAPYTYGYGVMTGNNALQDFWAQGGLGNYRWPWLKTTPSFSSMHPSTGGAASANAMGALIDGPTATKGAALKTYFEYANEMLLSHTWARVDPIGWEVLHSGGAHPSTEVIGAGYYTVNTIIDAIVAYDIMIGNYRSDQQAGGLTPIEDYYIRDHFARWVVMCNTEMMGSGTSGLWDTAKQAGVLMIAMTMTEYDTDYYGASGYGTATEGAEYAPFIGSNRTWQEILFETPSGGFPGYPDQGKKFDPGTLGLWTSGSNWANVNNDNNFAYFGPMKETMEIAIMMTAMYEPTVSWPILEAGVAKAINGELTSAGGQGPVRYGFSKLVNEYGHGFGQIAFDGITDAVDAEEIDGGGGSDPISFNLNGSSALQLIWCDRLEFTYDGSGSGPTPTAPPVRYNAIGGAPVWAF